jgi:hypothetical protein
MSKFKTFEEVRHERVNENGKLKLKETGVNKTLRMFPEQADALNEQTENSLLSYRLKKEGEEKKTEEKAPEGKHLSRMNKAELNAEVAKREGIVVADNATNKEIAEAIRVFDSEK